MKLVVISNAPIIKKHDQRFAYSPYVKEMAVWAKYADEVAFCCPEWKNEKGLLISEIPFSVSKNFLLSDFNITTIGGTFKAFFQIIYNCYIIFRAMFWADHIHLRCPGNVGLLGAVVQIFFPHKIKTAKYAGNWDPKAKQPLSYRLQKYILSNTFLTRKMQVLVYGTWEGSTKNIKPFFTASYKESDKQSVLPRSLKGIVKMVFVGTLSSGKRPLYAIQLVEELQKKGFSVQLSIFGEGEERKTLEAYILNKKLSQSVILNGNQNSEVVQKNYQESHFVLLASQSEGWPKVIAEGMFWGCVPLATAISCVPFMLDFGNRGVLLAVDLENDAKDIQDLIQQEQRFQKMSLNAIEWSREYTLDKFEQEIKLLLHA
ncbi:glycosyltransferase [Flavobacterium psychrophilum]|uniref:glycosyltransferase n=1 Tax=Flavobacterium psychrophilum TaxID=96345 RepID=UPI0004F66DB4|nr:glycosyltransferase [Flavobacterium psychrophilum]AIN73491.1 glycosyl transferase [Flavobacterium psychrophilum FPG3]EKT2069413.1 glycosyltransferase [Flavobacterium psychrophilum]EKT2071677.1 glycosyltransferase [Flavobacterium psychrophilum]EKT4491198.1 glycosyltransferase [Flavobacterium psychrophilum]ELM3643254.1 glycosyltransferase [Flavobacterium psychrophilum]